MASYLDALDLFCRLVLKAVRILKAARISPAAMVTLFEKLEQLRLDITRSPTSTASKDTFNPDKTIRPLLKKNPAAR